jgi:hypothetical protein
MKMKKIRVAISLFVIILLLPNCSRVSSKEKDDAKKILVNSSQIAEMWLNELDNNGYSYLTKLKLSDLLKTEINEAELQNYIINNERIFGRVQERKFIGAHFWLHNKLLTYFPNYDKKVIDRIGQTEAKDGFYTIDPKYMGLQKSSDMFKSFPKGNYLILMYKSIPTNKPTAEEMIILWQDNNDTWQVVSYKITDDL